ncbi:MAG: hypothetical protein KAT34_18060 [Candidatus Aminicenantes bacterium]|nr:hypothetical protein [Candidatus Aminicenantes bacterium]
MPDKGTKKKVTKVGGGESSSAAKAKEAKTFVASDESKGKATKFRIFAIISWIVAIGVEVWAVFLLQKPPINTTWLIVMIVVIFIFAVIGSLLWKKANRFDPASEKDKVRFFIQNQLGLIISVIAFLPLIIIIFANKDLKGKQKGLVGTIAIIALVIAGYFGIDFNPPSIEQYTEQTAKVESLMGTNNVFWTKSGTKYHTYSDCYHINTNKTEEIFSGTVAQARELKNITELCNTCEKRAEKEKSLDTEKTTEVKEE